MRRVVLLVVGVLTLLLLSNGAVLAAWANATQQNVAPRAWQSADKLVTEERVVSESDGLALVISTKRVASDGVEDLIRGTAAASQSPASAGSASASSSNYQFTGYKWDVAKYPSGVPYSINPSGAMSRYGLSQSAVVGAVKKSLETWDGAVKKEMWNDTPSVNLNAQASTSRPDYKNVVTWGQLQPGVVAMSYMWMYTSTGRYADVDLVFNTYYRWGIDPDGEGTAARLNDALDIQDICTHEIGHWMGLGDLYSQSLSTQTMYGYVYYGETQKITLAQGDIAGAQALYPN